MSFWSELTRNGVPTNRRIRKEIKHQEAVTCNLATPEHYRKDFRRRVFLALDALDGVTVTRS